MKTCTFIDFMQALEPWLNITFSVSYDNGKAYRSKDTPTNYCIVVQTVFFLT